MPRQAREKSASGIYHIIMRSINRQIILLDDDDYSRFILSRAVKLFPLPGLMIILT